MDTSRRIGSPWGSSGRRRATGDGLGLGLSIVATTVQVHHGAPTAHAPLEAAVTT
ncbi:hypothetical protein [Nonomuraea sp. NPDC049141]|uniref:hypothetical protein n=1 Tax=Nonomuraea sp. NPDC049141 TaxID=3155500 RepID=UPI0033F9383E